jgi:hypothetical protein
LLRQGLRGIVGPLGPVYQPKTKRRPAPRMFGNEIQKIPLWHEGDEFAVRRQMRKIRDSRFFGAEVHVNLPHLLMRLAQELFEQPEFVQQLQGGGMNGFMD